MCGLSGYVGNTKADKHALRVLLIDNEVRGYHATGIANVEGEMDKSAIEVRTYVGYDIFDSIADSKLVMCHNRWATMKNKDDDEAAHPFRVDDRLIGAHNGFIPEWEYQAKKLKISIKDIKTDSEIIFRHLANNDYNPKCLSDIEGAMALSWIDLKTKMLWLYRRSSRPLYIGEDSAKRLYYSSREAGLWMLGGRGNIELEENIAYGFKNGILIKLIPVKEPKIYIPMDQGLASFKYKLNSEERALLGMPKVKEYKSSKSKKKNTTKWPTDNSPHSYSTQEYDEWYRSLRENKTNVSIDRSKILMGSLEGLAEVSINDWNANHCHQLMPMEASRHVNKHGTTTIVMKVTSSKDHNPVPNAVIFIDHPDADQYMTTNKGFATIPVPKAKVGGFMRIGVLPYPYDELYHTSLLSLNEGEVMEVSLDIPFRSADREKAKKEKEELNRKKNSQSKNVGGDTTEIRGKVVDINRGSKIGSQNTTRGSEDEPEREMVSTAAAERWEHSGSEDAERNGWVANHYEQEGIGVHEQYGFLTKTVDNDNVTIFDSKNEAICDIDPQEFWSYAYEYRGMQQYDNDFVSDYTDTLWGYMRFVGYSMQELLDLNTMKKPLTANDIVVMEEVEKEATDFKQL